MRLSLKILILAAAYIANTMGAGAQESYLDRLAEQILSSNPELVSMRHAANAEDYSMKAGNQLDAPEIEVEHLFGEAGVKNKTGITVSQSFDWPGAYRARSKAADLSRRARQLSLQAAYRDKVQEAKLLMLDIIYCRARKDMLDSAYENVSQLLDFTVKAYDNGELTILDVNRLRLSRLSLRSQCSEARIAHQSLRSSLEALAGHRDVSSVWEALTDFPYEPILPEEAYTSAVEESNPAIAAARARAEALRSQSTAEKLTSYPGFSIGYRYSREEGHDFHGFTAGISLPFLRKNYAAKAAAEQATAAEFDILAARSSALSSMYSLRAEATALAADNEEYARVFSESDNMRLLSMAYRGGEMNSLDYLTNINYFLEARMAALESQYKREVAAVRLNSLLPAE